MATLLFPEVPLKPVDQQERPKRERGIVDWGASKVSAAFAHELGHMRMWATHAWLQSHAYQQPADIDALLAAIRESRTILDLTDDWDG